MAEDQARQAWNAMGGRIDWAAIPLMMDLFDVDDAEMFVHALIVFRDTLEKRDG